ncbi:hypothetical protein LQ384_28860 [Rhodococcus rhodochrous]|uniref:DNA-binding protein n=1 Tax=Rhodococcus rhodochrous TaxID=1829 RepID=A0AAW4XPI5_RHORH|nr:hypothetical protein [Rhodococcus rhodochrous]MCD2115085.1 hypothetical protein [Rhodococcus rhodochrous]
MVHADIDPRGNPEYWTLSQAGKECGVSVRVLQELIAERKIVDGVARTKNGHAYLHRDHVPSWSQVESILAGMYRRQLDRVERAMKHLEAEVEAVRFDLNEALADPDGPLGDDLIAAGEYGRDNRKTLAGAVSTLNSEVMALTVVKRYLVEVRRTV